MLLLELLSVSSPESEEDVDDDGEWEGVEREFTMVTWRRSDTDTVASTAISRARSGHRGLVVKTTKKGTQADRGKVEGTGSVTCDHVNEEIGGKIVKI